MASDIEGLLQRYPNVFSICSIIIVKPYNVGERTTEGGIIVPETAEGEQLKGCVIAVGSEADYQLFPGCEVIYPKKAAVDVKHQGETLHAILDENLLMCLGQPDKLEND